MYPLRRGSWYKGKTHRAFMLTDTTVKLDLNFYMQEARNVARQLLGCLLVVKSDNEWLAGWIVETEAYLDRNDPACHSTRGVTKSNATMFGRGGLLYVYSIHAKYCMNIVTGGEGFGQAVLLRALQPCLGIEKMRANCRRDDLRMIARGPSRLCQAVQIDRSWDGVDLAESDRIWIARPRFQHKPKIRTAQRPRIGVTSAQHLLLRYFIDGNRFVSGRAGDHASDEKTELDNSKIAKSME